MNRFFFFFTSFYFWIFALTCSYLLSVFILRVLQCQKGASKKMYYSH